ncbi:TonB-dependent receptor [Novosphingobium sp. PS1R-30]|uniref:TonB-dependent receptor n=1 Tax=Novosphingobium anseongense TaxID=3133436 RepID=A0ABU8RY16_9SPHN
MIALVTSTTAMAQDVPASDDAADAEAIVVTGSRIARPDLESTVPISIVSNDAILKQGNNNLGDTLNDLPQLRSSFSQQNPGLGVGIAGLNLLDLRGLGTQRTLVLVNGRRHVAADILNNGVSVDVNTIPSDLIERVDIVTGGNSAIYGSDAIAGVVNFILKKDYDGLQLTGKAGISTPGAYGANQQLSAIAGKNFADGRGNVTLAFEYSNQERVYGSDISFLKRVDGLVVNDIDPAGTPNGSDGNPDRIFVRDIRQANINRFGLVPINQRVGSAACGTGVNGVPYNCTYLFQPDGTLVAQTGTRYGSGVIGSIVGGNGQTGREDQLISVLPKQQRYNANILAHYEFSPAFDLFFEGKYSRINTVGGNAGPTGIQGQFTQFDSRERVRLDNPFLSPSARATITNALLASGCNPSVASACSTVNTDLTNTNPSFGVLTPQQIAAIAAGTYRFVVSRNLADIGNRDEFFKRQTYRAVLGARGSFWDNWRYEVSANYGRTEENTLAKGYIDKQRFNLAMDAGRNPVTGAIQCRSQFDPASAVAGPNNAFNRARLAADIAACVPYNPFGASNNAASAAYFQRDYTNESWAEQMVFSAFVSGDLGQNLKLWGGPVRFALGVEHREEDAHYAQDDFAAAGNSTAVAFGSFDPPTFKVSEAFAEVQIPIFEDRPFFHELTLSGAARVAKYQGAVGTVWAYNGGVDWAPIPDIRFRANYSRAVRAPNQTETFGELIPNFAPAFTDPCTTANIGAGTQFRGANCRQALGANLANIASKGAYSLPILSGVNPDLKAETSKSLTLGAVFRPRFVPGLSVAVDYYSIKVDGVIVALTAQQIVNSCYDQPTLDNVFCGLFQRFQGPGAGPFTEVPGEVLGNTLISAPLNFAKRVRRGIDTQVNYTTDLGGDWKVSASAIYTHNFQNSNYQNPAIPNFENRILSELGDPKDEFRINADVTFRRFTLGYQVQYISPMYVNFAENYVPLQDRAPQDADYSEIPMYPAVWYHDVRFEYKLDEDSRGNRFSFFGGVDNLFNEIPPLGQTATGERVASGGDGGNIYSIRGRQFYVGFKANF